MPNVMTSKYDRLFLLLDALEKYETWFVCFGHMPVGAKAYQLVSMYNLRKLTRGKLTLLTVSDGYLFVRIE